MNLPNSLSSARIATAGSTRVARNAGIRLDNSATATSTIGTKVNVTGSEGATP